MKLALVLVALAAAPAPPPTVGPVVIEPPPPQEASLAAHGAYLAKLKARAEKIFASGDMAEACALIERIVELAPEDPGALLNLGFCRFKQSDRDEGKEVTFKAIARGDDKTRRDAYYNLGTFDVTPEVSDVVGGPTANSSCGQYGAVGRCSQPMRWCTVLWNNGGKSLEEVADEVVVSVSRSETIDCVEEIDRASVLAIAGRGDKRPEIPCAEVQENVSLTRRAPDGNTAALPAEKCKVVYADACTGRVGLYCRKWDNVRLRYFYVGEERTVAPARE